MKAIYLSILAVFILISTFMNSVNAGIIDVSIRQIQEGIPEAANIEVKNEGLDTGGFSIRISECSFPFTPIDGEATLTLESGETKTIERRITFSETNDDLIIRGTCIAEMKETTSQSMDTYEFDVDGKQIQECIPGRKNCKDNTETGRKEIKQCSEDGMVLEIVDICGEGEDCRIGHNGYECTNNQLETTLMSQNIIIISLILVIVLLIFIWIKKR